MDELCRVVKTHQVAISTGSNILLCRFDECLGNGSGTLQHSCSWKKKHVLKMILTWQFFVPFMGWKGYGLNHLDEVKTFVSLQQKIGELPWNYRFTRSYPDTQSGWSTSDFDFMDFARPWVLDFFLATSHVPWRFWQPPWTYIATQEMSTQWVVLN